MKYLAIALAFIFSLGTATTVLADVNVVPKVGYQFQTHNTNDKQVDTIGQYQKNRATYGLEVNTDIDKQTQVGIEYLATNSNLDSYQIGFIGNRTVGDTPFYATSGVGYTKLKGDYKNQEGFPRNQEGAYINLGVGAKHQLTNLIAVKGEVRGQYLMNQNQWTPVALVGFEFNTSEFGKPYSVR